MLTTIFENLSELRQAACGLRCAVDNSAPAPRPFRHIICYAVACGWQTLDSATNLFRQFRHTFALSPADREVFRSRW
jgi:hypothetical protein